MDFLKEEHPMFLETIKTFSRILFPAWLVFMASSFLFSGCGRICPIVIDPYVYGPQVIVNPDAASLGVASLIGTDIVFEGVGFQPGESVFITLEGVEDDEVVVASDTVNADGTFSAEVTNLVKVTEILRGDMEFDTYSEDGQYDTVVLITQMSIPAGSYTARATGMLSNREAETTFTFTEPSKGDRLKDWIGAKKGKIKIVAPMITVKPSKVSLGVASLMGTDIVFEGIRFEPDDSVYITLMGPGGTDSVVAESKVQPDGTFSAKVSTLAKVTEILRGDIEFDTYSEEGEYDTVLVITQEPIPAGSYTARATGLLSDQKADAELTFKSPSRIDRIKDWIGKKKGKIQDKRQ